MTKLIRKKFEPITIIEPQKYDVKIFNDPIEFTEFYREHEDKFKNVSTMALNRMYKVPGYRISIVKKGTENEELILKTDYYSGKSVKMSNSDTTNSDSKLVEQIKLLEESQAQIKDLSHILTQRIDNIERFLAQLK